MSPDKTGGDTIHHTPNGDTAMILYRLSQIEGKVDRALDDHEVRLRKVEDELARLSERLTLWQLGQAVFTTVVGAVAAAVAALLGHKP